MKTYFYRACLVGGVLGLLGSCSTSTDNEKAAAKSAASSPPPPACDTNPTFNPKAGTLFSEVERAEELTKTYRENNGQTQKCSKARAFYFNEDLVKQVLDQQDAVGFRVYLARNNKDGVKDEVILVGVNEKGQDLLGPIQGKTPGAIGSTYLMLGAPMKCPYNCDTSGRLYGSE
ncbi:hypothetical protein GCM10027346_02590 [Hymenobacter seoulensis]